MEKGLKSVLNSAFHRSFFVAKECTINTSEVKKLGELLRGDRFFIYKLLKKIKLL